MRRVLLVALTMSACVADVTLGGPNTIVRVDAETDGANCASGGLAIFTGLDLDDDDYLDDDEILSTQYVCNGESSVACDGGTILTGTITVRAAADFDQLTGVDCIDGQLVIAGTDADALPLESLAIVTGDLVVAGNARLATLAGLAHLRQVGGSVLVQGNDALSTLDGLGQLERAAAITVVGNDGLVDLTGLEAFVDLHTNLTISNNAALASLRGLHNLATTDHAITVRGNRSLADAGALNGLREVALLEISGNAVLPAISLAGLAKVSGRIIVTTNATLGAVELPALTGVGDFLRFDGNGALASIDAPNLLTVASFLVSNDPSLARLSAPSLAVATTNVDLLTLPKLTSLDFTSLVSIGGTFNLLNATLLPDLAGLSSLGSVGGSLILSNAGALVDFTGLAALSTVAGDLTITNNPRLSSFTGLGAMTEVGNDLTITGNAMLPVPASQAFADGITVHGTITIN